MTDQPSPYSPPPYQPSPYYGYGHAPPPDLLRPARWASGLLFVIAAMFLLIATCAGVFSVLPIDDLPAESQKAFRNYEEITKQPFQTTAIISAVVTVLIGLAALVLAIFVRKGTRGWVIASLIATSGLIIYLLLNLAGTLLVGGAGSLVCSLCIMAVPMALVIMLIVNLVRALQNSGQTAQHDAYAQQWWQYHQQQMYYQQQQQQQPPMQPPPPPPQ